MNIEGRRVTVKGPKGELSREFRPEVSVERKGDSLLIVPLSESRLARALWGLTRTLLANMVQGVLAGYEKRLEIEGVGYRAAVEGDSLALQVGFSHPLKMKIPEHMGVQVDKNVIRIGGPDKEQVGQFAAAIRRIRPPEPYKGKGIRYEGEVVRRKLGKKAVASGGGA